MITLKTFERTPSLAELKVSYRRGRPKDGKQERVPFFAASPVGCEKYLRSVWDADTLELREEFVLLCLSGAHEVLGWVRLHTGGFGHAPVDVRLVVGVALQTASSAVVVAHNHPGGGPVARGHRPDEPAQGGRRPDGHPPARPPDFDAGRILQLRRRRDDVTAALPREATTAGPGRRSEFKINHAGGHGPARLYPKGP